MPLRYDRGGQSSEQCPSCSACAPCYDRSCPATVGLLNRFLLYYGSRTCLCQSFRRSSFVGLVQGRQPHLGVIDSMLPENMACSTGAHILLLCRKATGNQLNEGVVSADAVRTDRATPSVFKDALWIGSRMRRYHISSMKNG